jgi:hypothetical protein
MLRDLWDLAKRPIDVADGAGAEDPGVQTT